MSLPPRHRHLLPPSNTNKSPRLRLSERVLGMAWRIPSIATAVTIIRTLFSTRQTYEKYLATLFKLNGKGFPNHRDIHHPPTSFFCDVAVTNARQFVFDRLVHGHFIGQTTFETAAYTGDA